MFASNIVSAESHLIYFWLGAVHMLATTTECASMEKIAARLRMPPVTVQEALDSLESLEIITRRGKRWHSVNAEIYLPCSSSMSAMSHANWRLRAAQNIQSFDPESLHFSQLFNVSRSDLVKLKAKLADCVRELRQITIESGRDDTIAITLDLFRI